ncbi:NAD-dependent succinate-semialdehyde dehydrogenase [Sphingobium chlorophenolicum]|uniref:Succinate-semialdehyde dehydrogenase n=1 Tax=Sphingobium chlorophenolicum TaxID=46429 RepID=A0A081RAX1_SPHCR|nr:NAD-dependent succinate-semialdehyde dehydrogenase [Sphingobium chlorophenolicum]KEQ52344.1 Succinate-semialdehyde dehydrogenase [Sphingobium chlorophenolicum]
MTVTLEQKSPAIGQDIASSVPHGLFIDGQWRPAADGSEFDVRDPCTGDVIARLANARPSDAMDALDAADAAFASWSRTPARERGELLRRVFDLVMRDRDRIAEIITLEMGKPLREAQAEVTYGGEFLRWFSEEAVRISGRFGSSPEGNGDMIVSRHALGPALLITPWNFPLAMATRKIAPALAAGCTVVVKPAALTPLTTLYLTALFEEAGLPPGVVNVIPTTDSGGTTGPIIADSRLRKISFTGSTPVGRMLLEKASVNILRTSMELGGNAPFLVFEDADLDRAVEGAIIAKFRNIGQACTAANRFIVHASVAEEFSRRVAERVAQFKLGSGFDPEVTIGPLIDEAAASSVDELVKDATARGAKILVGGQRKSGPGTFYEPTVLTNVSPDSRICREEIFGPVLPIMTFETDDEAIRIANDTEYGLVGYIFTQSITRGQRLINDLQTGMMGWNVGMLSNAAAPFGGVKMSGLGREGGAEGIDEYLTTKYSLLPTLPRP